MPFQPDLFAPSPRPFDEEALMRRLREAEAAPLSAALPGFSRAAIRRLMTPLPPITVPR